MPDHLRLVSSREQVWKEMAVEGTALVLSLAPSLVVDCSGSLLSDQPAGT
jgi:hypothetical protein